MKKLLIATMFFMSGWSYAVESITLLDLVKSIQSDVHQFLAEASTPDMQAIGAAIQTFANALGQQPNLDQAETQASDPTINMQEYAKTLTQQQIKNILTTVDDPLGTICKNNPCLSGNSVASAFINSGTTNIYRTANFAEAKSVNPDDQMLNIDTLLGTLAYTTPNITPPGSSLGGSTAPTGEQKDQRFYARRFIQIVSGLSDPIRLVAPLDYIKMTDDNKRAYLARMQNFSALVSVGLNNLFQMYVERLPTGSNQPSLAAAEAAMASRRMTPEWRKMMESASATTIARENLYLLAEINYQLYRSRQQQERILATLSTLQLQDLSVMLKTAVAPTQMKGTYGGQSSQTTTTPSTATAAYGGAGGG